MPPFTSMDVSVQFNINVTVADQGAPVRCLDLQWIVEMLVGRT